MPVGGEERGGDSRLSPPSNESKISRNLQSTSTEARDTTPTMEDHRDALKSKIGSVPAPGEVGGSKLERKELDLGIFGESWKELHGNLQSANTIPHPYIEIISSWSADRNKRKFIRKMDTTYHSICRLRDVREEKHQSMVYTESTDSSRHCHLPPPLHIFQVWLRIGKRPK